MHNRRKEKLPSQARKARTIIKARQFILHSELVQLPVDPCSLYETYGWHLHSWDEARDIMGVADPFYIKASRAEARTVTTPCNDFFTIYDSTVVPHARIRWTIAHEIGHIVLGHFHDFAISDLNKCAAANGGSPALVLELEADIFAAELLQPMPILKAIGDLSVERIQELCNVSRKAATNRKTDLAWWGNTSMSHHLEEKLIPQFGLFLNSFRGRIRFATTIIVNEFGMVIDRFGECTQNLSPGDIWAEDCRDCSRRTPPSQTCRIICEEVEEEVCDFPDDW